MKVLSVLTFPPGSMAQPRRRPRSRPWASSPARWSQGILLHTGGRSPDMLGADRRSQERVEHRHRRTVHRSERAGRRLCVARSARPRARDRHHQPVPGCVGKDATCHLHEIETNDGA